MFDRVEILARGGDGGDGAISFRREKFVPFGGPDGGEGGRGGDVIIMADPGVTDLRMFRHKKFYRAGNGGDGRGQKKHGKAGENSVLAVPMGTLVMRRADGEAAIADLEQPRQQVVVAVGGKGGFGNTHFVSSTSQAPRIAQKGETGEEVSLVLELRLIAEVGIIGYPNVGKSTLLAAASAARPKIADYPFTTREPALGMVEVGRRSFILAEIPGLIEDAHLGRGLGHDFLRHAMRTRVFIHLIDGSSESPVEDMTRVNEELRLFDSALASKPQLVVVNKIDLPQVRRRLAEIMGAFNVAGITPRFISAATGEGVPAVMAEAMKLLSQVAAKTAEKEKVPPKVFHPQPRVRGVSVRKEGSIFVLVAPEVERIIARTGMDAPEVRGQIKQQLTKMGVDRAMAKAGVKPGEKVRCGDIEWDWY